MATLMLVCGPSQLGSTDGHNELT